MLPKDYPLSPPRIQMLTPSGRFIPGHDICTSASHYHPELWTPQWTLLGMVQALRLHFGSPSNEIGGMSASYSDRYQYALASRHWHWKSVNHARMIQQGMFDDNDDNRDRSATAQEEDTEVERSLIMQTSVQQENEDPATLASAARSNSVDKEESIQHRTTTTTQIIEGENVVLKRKRKTKSKKNKTKPDFFLKPEPSLSMGETSTATNRNHGSHSTETDDVMSILIQKRARRRQRPSSLTAILLERGTQIWLNPPRLLGFGLLLLFVWLNRL
jgi:hypothetical protein